MDVPGKKGSALAIATAVAGMSFYAWAGSTQYQVPAWLLGAVTVKSFGAVGDAISVNATVSVTSGAAALTAVGASFTSNDVGKLIRVPGAGAAGAVLQTTIAAYTDATHVTLAANAGTTLSAAAKSITYGTDDTAAIEDAIAQNGADLYFPAGRYLTTGLTADGRISLRGDRGKATLIGGFTYDETGFPTSADTVTPLTDQTVGFFCRDLDFESDDGYGLTLAGDYSGSFEIRYDVADANFYGKNGMLVQHGYGSSFCFLNFLTTEVGLKAEGCTNVLYLACRGHNQRNKGLWIDVNATNSTRRGGESHKLVGCEFAVCSTGIYARLTQWMVIDGTLIDYCGTPLITLGCQNTQVIGGSYLGVSGTAASRFSALSGYVAPPVTGVAWYGAPATYSGTDYPCSGDGKGSWFVQYQTGTTNPLVYFDKALFPQPYPIEHAQFLGNKFMCAADHSMPTLLRINGGKDIVVADNYFEAINNTAGTITSFFDFTNCAGSISTSGNHGSVSNNGTALAPPNSRLADTRIRVEDATNTGVTNVLFLRHATTGTPGNGIGIGVAFEAETANDVFKTGVVIEAVAKDTTSSSEDFDIVVKLMKNGAAAVEMFRFNNDGHLVIGTTAMGTDNGFLLVSGLPQMWECSVSLSNGNLYYYDATNGKFPFTINPNAPNGALVVGAGVSSTAGIASSSPTGGVGYATGAGGTVAQATSKATGVTLNKVTGQVTMNNAALAAAAKVLFVVTNSAVAATDGVMVWVVSGGTANAYRASVTAVAAGSFTVTVENITGGSLSEAPVIGFAVIKAVAA